MKPKKFSRVLQNNSSFQKNIIIFSCQKDNYLTNDYLFAGFVKCTMLRNSFCFISFLQKGQFMNYGISLISSLFCEITNFVSFFFAKLAKRNSAGNPCHDHIPKSVFICLIFCCIIQLQVISCHCIAQNLLLFNTAVSQMLPLQ